MANGALPMEYEMPGLGYDFEDVTTLFVQGGAELNPDSVLFMESFTLQEAMSVLEIGEPRLDSGLVLQAQLRPPFDPLARLLPEELCWILDRAMAYETEFHAGNLLAHTVHTLLYVHHLAEIEPDVITFAHMSESDPLRPIELVTVVLRIAVQGLLKCCDFTWRELAKGASYDTEDWQSDKCEVPLLEGVAASFIVLRIDSAINWVSACSLISENWKMAIRARLLLRKTLLLLMDTDVNRDRPEFLKLIALGREYLQALKDYPSPIECSLNSPATLAFDPYIGRQLQTATPIRVVPPPSLEDTYAAVSRFLDGLYEIGLLSVTDQLTTWQTMGDLRLWLSEPPIRPAFIRSLTQSAFYDGFLVMNKYSFGWMINQFFYETCGVNYDSIHAVIADRWQGDDESPPTKKLERVVHKLITPHIRALWHNPPRRRRYFMKSLVEWHIFYEALVEIRDNLDLEGIPAGHLMTRLPDIALMWRLSIVREVVLSGFQLELYAQEERPFAYWYSVRIIDEHLDCLDNLLGGLPDGSPAHRETMFQIHFLTALQSICTALFVVSITLMTFDWERARPNFYRRYKWAFRTEYDASSTPVVGQPELSLFIRECGEVLQYGGPIPASCIDLARSISVDLVRSNNHGGWAGVWANDRMQLIHNLVAVCDDLKDLPESQEEVDNFDPKVLKWNPRYHPWFPSLKRESCAQP